MLLKSFLTAATFAAVSSLHAQTPVVFGPELHDRCYPNSTEMEIDALGNLYAGVMFPDNDWNFALVVKKYDNGAWVSIGDVVPGDPDLLDFDLAINPLNNTVSIVYAKTDGIYTTTYDGSWSAPVHHTASPPEGFAIVCGQAIDPVNGKTYILYVNYDSPSMWNSLVRFDHATQTFEPIPIPSFQGFGGPLQATKLAYNPYDGGMYLVNGEAAAYRFNGADWDVVGGPLSDYAIYRSFPAFAPGGNHDLVLAYSAEEVNAYRIGVASLNTVSGNNTVILPPTLVTTGSNYTALQGFTINPGNGFLAAAYITAINNSQRVQVRVYNGNEWFDYLLPDSSGMQVDDIDFGINGELYITTFIQIPGPINIYTLDPGYLSVPASPEVAFDVFPNPSSGTVTVSCAETAAATLTDVHGKIVARSGSADIHAFDLAQLATGMYLVYLTTEDGKTAVKQVVRD